MPFTCAHAKEYSYGACKQAFSFFLSSRNSIDFVRVDEARKALIRYFGFINWFDNINWPP